ncbi:MAG: DUF480 domain-containing protein [Verrucomicrobia bacterium]|nr:DUF480 domain-containing protein [Verrucomicrobiota bacterium]
MLIKLSDIELRVLACLIEKEITTPDYYPLSLNSLTAACNQKSNREPEMKVDDKAVVQALDHLRYEHHIVWHVTVPGSRVPKYKHDIQSRWKFSAQELAILCELMLRGPQTVGELRTHGERLYKFTGLDEVEGALQELIGRPEGAFVAKLPREPGRKEPRFAHLFAGDVAVPNEASEPPPEPARLELMADNEHFLRLESEIASLRSEIDSIKAQFAEFKKQFE